MNQNQLFRLTPDSMKKYLSQAYDTFCMYEELFLKEEKLTKQNWARAETESGQENALQIAKYVCLGVAFISFVVPAILGHVLSSVLIGLSMSLFSYLFYELSKVGIKKHYKDRVRELALSYTLTPELLEVEKKIQTLKSSLRYKDACLLPNDFHNSTMVHDLYHYMKNSVGFNNLQMALIKLREQKDEERRFRASQELAKKRHQEMLAAQQRVENAIREGNEQAERNARIQQDQADRAYYLAKDEAFKREQEFREAQRWFDDY